MLNPKNYLILLFATIFFIVALAVGYVYGFSKEYPPPFTQRISFDAKIKFIRDHIDPDSIDTLIVGSSIGMNNVLGSVLEKSSTKVKHALNLSVYEATTLQVEQIVELADAFPNLKRIIYSAQYSDFPHARRYENYDPELLKRLIRKELSFVGLSKVLFDACNNLLFCQKREKMWKEKHTKNTKFTYLGFDHTGSVPLNIYSQKGVGGRWYLPHPGIMHHESFQAVGRMAQRAQERGIRYYVAHQPYREPLVKKHEAVRNALIHFDNSINSAIKMYDGTLIQLQQLHLSDEFHADRSHLNEKGATVVSQEIGKVIDEVEK